MAKKKKKQRDSNQPVIQVDEVKKIYKMGDMTVEALRGLDLKIWPGEMVAIMGPSGSGKSTLMNIIGCLDTPSKGKYLLDGIDVSKLNDDSLAQIRWWRWCNSAASAGG